jgi:uracil DNA glycosylase
MGIYGTKGSERDFMGSPSMRTLYLFVPRIGDAAQPSIHSMIKIYGKEKSKHIFEHYKYKFIPVTHPTPLSIIRKMGCKNFSNISSYLPFL